MESLANVILSTTADAALEALLASAGLASAGGAYQPEEPKDLMKVAESRKARK
ncbi:MAG: cyclic lactone autoinducer peptide [Clostridia bacterium]|nr:cyclic lactone autoinducer peptide [Clostridia bacterium]